MAATDTVQVYNENALFVSAVMLFGILAFHALYIFIINRCFTASAKWLAKRQHHILLDVSFLIAASILSMAHILEIWILGYSIHRIGLVSSYHEAIVFAGSTYTTVGYGNDPLTQGWQLVMVTMALLGALTIAWTTSVLFSFGSLTRSLQTKIDSGTD